ncbi:MAG TPA: transcription-repair coupling factor, partial [Acidimicrobiia bacterium]|nr:transcription-repair coupling factor [Acidimicrobiia bacterium]
MTVRGLLQLLRDDPAIGRVLELGRAAAAPSLDVSGPASLPPFAIAALADLQVGAGRPVLAVVATTREAEDLAAALRSLLPRDSVVDFPSWETLPHERLSPRSDTVGRRLAVLRRLAHPDDTDPATAAVSVLVAPVRAVLQPLVRGLGELEPVVLRSGDEVDLNDVAARLVDAGYGRVDLVDKRGDFAVRGGIVDVFPPTED